MLCQRLSHTWTSVAGSTLRARPLVARRGAIVIALVATCYVNSTRADVRAADLTAAQIVDLVKSREDSIRSVSATMKITEGITDEYKNFTESRHRAAREFAKVFEIKAAEIKEPTLLPPESYNLRFVKDDAGRERYEMSTESKKLLAIAAYNGASWHLFNGTRGSLQANDDDVKRFGQILGLDFRPSNPAGIGSKVRSLTGWLSEAAQQNVLSLADPSDFKSSPDEIGLVVRKPLPSESDRKYGICYQNTIIFKKSLSFAPVSSIERVVFEENNKFNPVLPDQYNVCTWSDYKERFEGIWLPDTYENNTFTSVPIPRLVAELPANQPLTDGKPLEYSYEKFNIKRFRSELSDIVVNVPLETKYFDYEFPLGTTINDTIKDKVYVVGGANDPLEELKFRRPRSSWKFYFFVTINIILFIAIVVLSFRFRNRTNSSDRADKAI